MRLLKELSMAKKTEIKYTHKDQWQWGALIRPESNPNEQFEIWTRVGTDTQPYVPPEALQYIENTQGLKKWEIFFADSHGNIDTATKGHKIALELFAAIETFVKDWIKGTKPDIIEFSSGPDEQSKFKLYVTLAKRIQKMGYKYFNIRKEQYLIRKELLR